MQQNDAEILRLMIHVFPELKEAYHALTDDQPVFGDAYEFSTLTLLPFVKKELLNQNEDIARRTVLLLNKMLSSEDKTVSDFACAILIEDLAYDDIKFFDQFTDDRLKAEMQPYKKYYHGK